MKCIAFRAVVGCLVFSGPLLAQGTASVARLAVLSGNGQVACQCLSSTLQTFQPISVQATDATGKPVAGATVTWAVTSGQATIGSATTVTAANGITGNTLNLVVFGTQATATVPYLVSTIQAVSNNNSVVFVETESLLQGGSSVIQADPPTYAAASLSQASLSAYTGTTLPTPILLHVAAAAGLSSGVPNVSVRIFNAQTSPTVSCAYVGGYSDPGTVLTDANGDAKCYPVLAGTGKGSFYILVGGVPGPDTNIADTLALQSFGPFSFTSIPGAPGAVRIISGNHQSGSAGQTLNTLVAQLVDPNGNAVPGQTMVWTVSPTAGASLTNAQTVTDNSGEVSNSATLNGQAFQVLVTVGLQSNPNISAIFVLTLEGGIASLIKVSGDAQSALINTNFALPLVVQVNNATGPVANYPVQFVATGPIVIASGTAVTTDASGRASATVKAGSTAGAATVTAIAGALSQTFNLISTNSSTTPTGLTLVSGGQQSAVAGSVFSAPIIVQVNSTSGPLAGYPVNFSVTGPISLSAATVSTNSNGQAEVTVQAGSVPGAATVIASAGGLLLGFGLTVIPPGASACNFTLVPSSQVIPAAVGAASVAVLTSPGCTWNASLSSSFLSVTSGLSGNGPGVPVQLSATANTSPASRSGTLTIGGQVATIYQSGTAPLLLLSPTSQMVQWQQQSAPPPAVPVSVFTAADTLTFTAAASSTGNWLTVSPTSGTAPAGLMVNLDPSSLEPGNYQGTVTVSASAANPSTQVFTVFLTVTAAGTPALSIDTKNLTYSFTQGAQQVQQQRILIGNSGGGTLSFHASASIASGGNWLSVGASGSGATLSSPQPLTVTVDPSALAAGTYTGLITVAADTTQTIPVIVTVSAARQTMQLSPTGLNFTAVVNGGVVPPQTFAILNGGSGSMDWSVMPEETWLSVSPASGSTDASSSTVSLVTVSVNQANMGPGQYASKIQVTSTSANNTPQFISVVLIVLPAGNDPGPIVLPSGLVFTGTAGGAQSAAQTISVWNLRSAQQSFTAAERTLDGGSWFTVTPVLGTGSPVQAITVTVSVSSLGLSPATRQGSLSLFFADGSVRVVNILYVLLAGASATCTPTKLLPLVTSLHPQFSIPAAWPNTLAVQVIDDCGSPHVSGTVTASFSNGDPSVPLVSLKNGAWMATWQVRNAGSPAMAVTLNADNPALKISGAVSVSGMLQTWAAIPILAAGGILNAGSYAPSAPLSPGAMISIFGWNLASGTASATQFPLPYQLSGSRVTIGGVQAPLLFSGSGQINAIIPYGLPVNTNVQVIVEQEYTAGSPEPIVLAAASPAIFTQLATGSGQGVIIRYSTGTYAQPGSPAQAGDEIVIYAGGLGATTPAATTGQAVTGSPLLEVPGVTLTIGGQSARVDYAGLVAGYSGLYQINAAVPAGLHGDALPVVLTVAGQSSPPVTMAVQ